MIKKVFAFFYLVGIGASAFGSGHATQASGTKMFDNITVNGQQGSVSSESSGNMIGDDTLPRGSIYGGTHLNVNKGQEIPGMEKKVDQSGRTVYKKAGEPEDSEDAYPHLKSHENDQEYKNFSQEYKSYLKLPEDQKTVQKQMQMKKKMYKELDREGMNFRSNETYFLKKENLTKGAATYMQNARQNLNNQNIAPEELIEREKNATRLYKDTIKSNDFRKQTEHFMKNVSTYGVLNKAYENINAKRQELASNTYFPFIKCQISRGLVPGYMCPLPNKDQITFSAQSQTSDLRTVNLEEAKERCNKFCYSDPDEYSCKKRTLISGGVEWSLLSSPREIWPEGGKTELEKSDLDSRLMVNSIDVSFSIPHGSGVSNEEWESFLSRGDGLKVKVSVLGSTNVDMQDETVRPSGYFTIVDGMIVKLNSSEVKVSVPVERSVKYVKVIVYKPYFSELPVYSDQYRDKKKFIQDHGGKVVLTSVKGNYSSDGVHYCVPLQTVPSPAFCSGEYEEFSYGDSQHRYLCMDRKHKIGPALKGGFFSHESCVQRCVFHKECIPTYRSYNVANMQESTWFKSKISCVDDPTNLDCTDEMCKQYFYEEHNAELNGDYSKRPMEEMVVYNDDRVVYTIKDGTLTNEIRPKIDLPGEESGSSVEEIKIKEEKDRALAAMIDRVTYNRSLYAVGEPSPMNLAYVKAVNGNRHTYLAGLLKPNSDDFENGILYKIYLVMKVEHIFRPKYGEWNVGGHMISTHDTPLVIKDVTYSVKDQSGSWIPFRRDLFREFLLHHQTYQSPSSQQTDGNGSMAYINNSDMVWTEVRPVQRFENVINPSYSAAYFKTMKFTRAHPYYQIPVSEYIEKDIVETNGILIHDQLPKNHETDIIRKYDGNFDGWYKSNPYDISYYILYAPASQNISYADLLCKFAKEGSRKMGEVCLDLKKPWETKYGLFDLLNPGGTRSGDVKHDGEINNNIKMFIMGKPQKMSVSMEISPSLTERGKRLYKFIFLYNEATPFDVIGQTGDGNAQGYEERDIEAQQ